MSKEVGGFGFGGAFGGGYYDDEIMKKQRVKRLKNEEDWQK